MELSRDECQGRFGDIGAVWDHVRLGQEMANVPTARHSRLLCGLQKLNCDRQEI
jgi:hypothetical protein